MDKINNVLNEFNSLTYIILVLPVRLHVETTIKKKQQVNKLNS